jgi:predicted metalloprotease with PDZ domain
MSRFALVHAGSPAETAGIAPGDEAVALDGLRLTADNLDSRLRDHHEGDHVTITVFRDHNLMRYRARLGSAPEDTCYLVLDPDVESAIENERDRWLNQD